MDLNIVKTSRLKIWLKQKFHKMFYEQFLTEKRWQIQVIFGEIAS